MTDSHDTTGGSGSANGEYTPDGGGSAENGFWADLSSHHVLRASSRPNFRGDKPTGSDSDHPTHPHSVRSAAKPEDHPTHRFDGPLPSRRELREQRELEENWYFTDEDEEEYDSDLESAYSTHHGYAEDDDAQPRHGQRGGDGFPSVVTWTTLGTMLPGLAIIRRDRRSIAGWVLLSGFLLGIGALVVSALIYGPTAFASRIVSSPKILRFTSIVLIVGLIIWVLVILRSFAVSKRGFRMPRAQKVLSWILVSSLIVIVGIPLGVGAAYANVTATALSKVFGENGARVLKREDLWADQERINVFLIGQDSADNREGVRPDTMLVASINTRSGQTTLISVPRNLAFPLFPEDSKLAETFPNGFRPTGNPSEDLINAVWDWAESSPEAVGDTHGLEPGMFATIQAVEASLGLKTDYWTAVNMKGFSDLITTMGGVELDVERPIPMGGGTNQTTGAKNQIFGWIDPGPQHLEGKKALWYTRSRDGADNYDRMCRQQRFLKAALEQMSPQEMTLKYPKLAANASDNIRTDIPLSDLSAFADLAMIMRNTEVKSAQITNDVVATLSPDYDALHAWVKEQTQSGDDKNDSDSASGPKSSSGGNTDSADDSAKSQGADNSDNDTQADSGSASDQSGSGGEDAERGRGAETADGKCYPHGYTPGDPWPGYPHNDQLRGGANSENGADG
ncbi:LCP family protein [Brevibacterium sp. Marseille-P9724]|uniref:LCP family protein n=1 Tax=Brevibacterium sp. Marseille-P9724 TaxID=2614125 RepID=UPI00125F1FA3|nr:LCP family protein [Brevibacterium sp. Marseille-P9724]